VERAAVVAWEFEKRGKIALGMHLLPKWYADKEHHLAEHEGVAEILDQLHLQKILMADEVFVVNVGGYIGSRTIVEIKFAEEHNKPIEYLEDNVKPSLGGCWYCHGVRGVLYFSTEFDCYLHLECLKNRLEKYPEDPEAQIFSREFAGQEGRDPS
jgi:hypothetical protein